MNPQVEIWKPPPTKQQEIDQLRVFAAGFGPDTYIGVLLCTEALDWFEQTVRADHYPDLLARAEAAEQASQAAERQITSLQTDLKAARGYITIHEGLKQKAHAHIVELEEAQDTARQREGVQQAWIEKLENEIIRLKAQLYDLQNR